MQWVIIIIALVLALPTYGVSIIFLIWYIFKTGAKRREKILNELILNAYKNHEDEMITTDLIYFEAAIKFVKEHNGTVNEISGNATLELIVEGDNVIVFFTKSHNNELMFSVSNEKLAEKRMRERMGINKKK